MAVTKEFEGVVVRRDEIDLNESRVRIESPYDRLFNRVLRATYGSANPEHRKDGFLEVPVSGKDESRKIRCAIYSRAKKRGFRLESHWSAVKNTVSLRLEAKGGRK